MVCSWQARAAPTQILSRIEKPGKEAVETRLRNAKDGREK